MNFYGQVVEENGKRKEVNKYCKKVHLCLGRPEYTVEVNFYGQVVEENGEINGVNEYEKGSTLMFRTS